MTLLRYHFVFKSNINFYLFTFFTVLIFYRIIIPYNYRGVDGRHRKKSVEYETTTLAVVDLGAYYDAL